MGLERLRRDERFADANRRRRNRDVLIRAIEDVTITKPKDHWIAVLRAVGVPCAPIQDYGRVYTDPHLLARDFFWDAPHPTLPAVRQLGSPMRFSDSKVRRGRAGPRFGEDSAAVLAELGYSANEIEGLMDQGIVKGPTAKAVGS